MKRRSFLKSGVLGSSLPLLGGLAPYGLADALALGQFGELALSVSDSRFEASRRFGAEARRSGIAHAAIAGDVTGLWFEHLDPQWRRQPSIIAGMTARQPLFCLERLAWDRGLRVVLRVEHEWQSDGSVRHSLSAPPHQLQSIATLLEGRQDWSERLLRLTAACSWGLGQGACQTRQVASPASRAVGLPTPLVTWVIAPARLA